WSVACAALVVGGIDHHGKLISAFLSQLAGDQLLKHFREKGLLQVIGVEADPTEHHSIFGELRKTEEGVYHVGVAAGPRYFTAMAIGLVLLVHLVHQHLAIHAEPPTEHFGQPLMLLTEVAVAHLLRLRTKQEAFLTVEEEHVGNPWTL